MLMEFIVKITPQGLSLQWYEDPRLTNPYYILYFLGLICILFFHYDSLHRYYGEHLYNVMLIIPSS